VLSCVRPLTSDILGDAQYGLAVSTADPSHIYTNSGWPLKFELFTDNRNRGLALNGSS
jgi:hypothetical protein